MFSVILAFVSFKDTKSLLMKHNDSQKCAFELKQKRKKTGLPSHFFPGHVYSQHTHFFPFWKHFDVSIVSTNLTNNFLAANLDILAENW